MEPYEGLASRWKRLGAAFIDAVILTPLGLIFFWVNFGNPWETTPTFESTAVLSAWGFFVYIFVNGYYLAQSGQTVGKKLLGIQIRRCDGSPVTLSRIATHRALPPYIAQAIPVIGPFLLFLDVLFVFRGDKRGVHDLIAGTIVVELTE